MGLLRDCTTSPRCVEAEGGGQAALMMYDVRSCGVKTVWSIHLLQIQPPATARAGKRNKTKLLSAISIF